MKLSLLAVALGVLGIATTPAQAAKIWIEPQGCSVEDCRAIHIDGQIQQEDFEKFEGIVAAEKIKNAVVYLDSTGGNMMASVRTGLKINSLGFSTYVADNTRCASGCAMIWLAGKPRYAAPTATIGFHQAYLKDRHGRIQRFPQGNAIVRDYYAKIGISKPAADFLLSADPKDMYWLNGNLAKGFGIEITSFSTAPKKEPLPHAVSSVPQQNTVTVSQPKAKNGGETTVYDRIVGAKSPGVVYAVAPIAKRVVLYDEDASDPNGKQYVGSVIWRAEQIKATGNQKPDIAVRADIEIPDRKFKMTMSFRRNTDASLPATHTAELTFTLPSDFSGGGVGNVPGILMKSNEQAHDTPLTWREVKVNDGSVLVGHGTPLAALAVKVTDGFFLVGLSNVDADRSRNMQLLKERSWFDVPLVYANQHRAIIAIEKGGPGERAFNEAFAAWGEDSPPANAPSATNEAFIKALASPAASSPQEQRKVEYPTYLPSWQIERTVPKGEKRRIGFHTSLFPDCTSKGAIIVRLTGMPKSGTVTFEEIETFPSMTHEDYKKCNNGKVPGTAVIYDPNPDFTGADKFSGTIIYPNGRARKFETTVSVE